MFFDIGATELLLIVIVAIIVIGPKDMPLAFRTAGRWIGKVRRVSGHFKTGVESMIREAELEEMDKKWREQNEKIMAEHPNDQMQPLDKPAGDSAAEPTAESAAEPAAQGEASQNRSQTGDVTSEADVSEPRLPLGGSGSGKAPY